MALAIGYESVRPPSGARCDTDVSSSRDDRIRGPGPRLGRRPAQLVSFQYCASGDMEGHLRSAFRSARRRRSAALGPLTQLFEFARRESYFSNNGPNTLVHCDHVVLLANENGPTPRSFRNRRRRHVLSVSWNFVDPTSHSKIHTLPQLCRCPYRFLRTGVTRRCMGHVRLLPGVLRSRPTRWAVSRPPVQARQRETWGPSERLPQKPAAAAHAAWTGFPTLSCNDRLGGLDMRGGTAGIVCTERKVNFLFVELRPRSTSLPLSMTDDDGGDHRRFRDVNGACLSWSFYRPDIQDLEPQRGCQARGSDGRYFRLTEVTAPF